jgi:Family of unknown function (DUF5677)
MQQSSWAAVASHFIGECFDYAKPFINQDFEGLPAEVRFVVAQLFIDCHLSSESVLLLVQTGKEWDADLIARSVMEGSIKFVYMLHGSMGDIEVKVNEYWNVLPLFNAIRHSEHAKGVLGAVKNPEAADWLPFHELLMPDHEVEAVRAKYSRQARREIEERWSFTGICRTLSLSDKAGLRDMAHLAHGYAMSSHLAHKDADGIGMVWERTRRSNSRQQAVTTAHAARIVSDICTFSKFRLWALLKATAQSIEGLTQLEAQYEGLLYDLSQAISQFNNVEYPNKA